MPEEIIEFIKLAGCGGFLFIVFYLYHKSTSEQLTKIFEYTYKLLETMIEQNTLQLTYLQKIDSKVSSNLWCPYVRKITGDKGLNEDE